MIEPHKLILLLPKLFPKLVLALYKKTKPVDHSDVSMGVFT